MFLLDDGGLVLSATDLGSAMDCEFATLRTYDALRGRGPELDIPVDPLLRRAGLLGLEHEQRLLAEYEAEHPGRVLTAPAPKGMTRAALEQAAEATLEALTRDDVDVVYQATLFDGSYFGYVDFIVRTPAGWEVRDTKIARSAKVKALLQTGAYADLLGAAKVKLGSSVLLVLGDGSSSRHDQRDLVPTFRQRRAHLGRLLAAHDAEGVAVAWAAEGVRACGRCAVCEPEVIASGDLFGVAAMNPSHRIALRKAGIATIADLANTTASAVAGVGDRPLRRYVGQAKQQLLSTGDMPSFVVSDPEQLGTIPVPSPGDLFFDFEGDPLYSEEGKDEEREWNLDYLFGVTDVDDGFTPFWAHDMAQEKHALRAFLDLVAERRAAHPDLHIYHYAPYEKAHLLSLAQRHGIGEDEVDDLLRSHVLVDLYPIVRKSLRVGSRSYSIKKLEPLYFGRKREAEGVTTAVGSVEEYAEACILLAEGRAAEADVIFDRIAEYNRDDCVSTRKLRDFLLHLASEKEVEPGSIAPTAPRDAPPPASSLIEPLLARAATEDDPALREAIEITAAALGYYRREFNTFARGHFDRLVQPIDEWVGTTRGALDVQDVLDDGGWITGPKSGRSRLLRLVGVLAPGTRFSVGDSPIAVYDGPQLFDQPGADAGARSCRSVTIVEVHGEGDVTVKETPPKDGDTWDATPAALAPGWPPRTEGLLAAIEEFAQRLLDRDGAPKGAAANVVLRRAPNAEVVPATGDEPDHVSAITTALLASAEGTLAVQGPPGSGKTYVGSHVIARLVSAGWGIGVVAQSHSVVENLLTKVVEAGVPKAQVGKALKRPHDVAFTEIPKDKQAAFISRQPGGFVVGGTAWDLVNTKRIGRRSLDLLVIDEAGQFALANTIAVAEAATRLLLLGDPQQLPQVSQATHPAPADASALGWIMGDSAVLDAQHGVFLEHTRRMHPDLTEVVSELSYAGELAAHASTADRRLDGVAPGLHAVPIRHDGNRTESAGEATAVVRIVQDLSGRSWTDDKGTRAMRDEDFIVVTPYNAQVNRIQRALLESGHSDVKVGTVDKFQGQEAPVAIVSMAASTPEDAPRGMSFLLNRNRLNVAISRAKWAAYLVHSPALADHLPRNAKSVADLSSFLGVISRSVADGAELEGN